MIVRRRVVGGALLIAIVLAAAGARGSEPDCGWLEARVDASLAPDPVRLDASPTRNRQLPLFRRLMRQPLAAPCVANNLLDEARRTAADAHGLFRWVAGIGGVETVTRPPAPADPDQATRDIDPLAAGIAWMKPATVAQGIAWPPPLPNAAALPEPLRTEIGRALEAMGEAHRQLGRALARLPAGLTPSMLREQLAPGGDVPDHDVDLRRLLPLLDREALAAGMLELVAAAQRLHRFVLTAATLPQVAWRLDTPLGAVVVDTTGRDNTHRLAAPLLVLDVGGNDRYEFEAAPAAGHLALVLDHGGDDRYLARTAGADPSAATLGYGILWDTAGDDLYEGTEFAQAAALFGAALLRDDAGNNRYVGAAHAQAYALGGIALLDSSVGNDEYVAQTHAQASAGPEAVAVLIDRGGDDRYTLGNSPLIRPSPQLPTHNTSMGQGAGRGLRAATEGGPSAAGGIGMLVDLAGDDRYTAQVFAQGAGFHEGLGMLIDAGGTDRFDAAWYAMGAAAHQAAGVLLKRGGGNDRYRATHFTSLGAAHDLSVAAFLDDGGDDDYALGDLGFGASHDDGVAFFVDLAGADRYEVAAAACRAFGFTQSGGPGTPAAGSPALALFVDRDDAADRFPATCRPAREAAAPRRGAAR
jgi:hypothetical protein